MRIGIDDKLRTCGLSHPGNMTVCDIVAPARCELNGDAVRRGESCLFLCEKARMGQDVYIPALNSGAVGSWRYRFDRGLTVDHNQPSTEPARVPGKRGDLERGHVGQFHAWNELDVKAVRTMARKPRELCDQAIYVRFVGVVSDRQCAIPEHLDAAQHFTGQ